MQYLYDGATISIAEDNGSYVINVELTRGGSPIVEDTIFLISLIDTDTGSYGNYGDSNPMRDSDGGFTYISEQLQYWSNKYAQFVYYKADAPYSVYLYIGDVSSTRHIFVLLPSGEMVIDSTTLNLGFPN